MKTSYLTFPTNPVPSMRELMENKVMQDYVRSKENMIKLKCEEKGVKYSKENILCRVDPSGNEYFYFVGEGKDVLIVALAPLTVDYHGDDFVMNNATLVLKQMEINVIQ